MRCPSSGAWLRDLTAATAHRKRGSVNTEGGKAAGLEANRPACSCWKVERKNVLRVWTEGVGG